MIFYFTGTGNSKYIAEKIAAGTGDRTVNIADCVQNEQYIFEPEDGESLGFVVPVYFVGIPIIVAEFLQKLSVTAKPDLYSYVVLNCGGSAANAEHLFQREFKTSAIFAVAMPDNYVPIYKTGSDEAIKEQLDKAEGEISVIIEHIGKRETGSFNALRGFLPHLITFIGHPLYKNGRKTEKFTVNESCTGCGLCEKVCPRKAIQIKGGKPGWVRPQCELCFACLHRCPTAAINYGKKSAKNGRYLNPRVQF